MDRITAMNLDYMQTLLALVRLGSFSAVAKESGMTQPAISFQIQKIEQTLNVRLLNRSSRKVSLTDAGKRVLKYAEIADIEYQKLLRDLEILREELVGELSIASSSTPGEYIVPALLGKFINEHPAITSSVEVMDSQTVLEGVSNGTYEIGFCGSVPPKNKDLKYFKVGSDRIKLIVSPDHPFAKMNSITYSMLENEPMITRDVSSGTRQSLERMIKQAGFDPALMNNRITLGSARSQITAVASGSGSAFVSSYALADSRACGNIKTVKISDLNLVRDFYCVYLDDSVNSRILREFIDFVKDSSTSE